jgi:disulfide bond formation protein DsbB
MTARTAIVLNALALYAIALVLLMAFGFQLTRGELPCPLCLLQRVALVALAVGPVLNIRHGPRPSHYAMSVLAAMAGAVVAIRQILLHILPGDPGYGSAFAGLHYYSWAAVIFAVAIVLTGVMMLFDRQFDETIPAPPPPRFATIAVWLVILIAVANIGSTLLECGLTWCADNPVRYELLIRGS